MLIIIIWVFLVGGSIPQVWLCLEPKMKYTVLDDIGCHFADHAVELVKAGYKFVYVVDNIHWEEKADDMRQDIQNRSVHAIATSIVFNRVPDQGLPDFHKKISATAMPMS